MKFRTNALIAIAATAGIVASQLALSSSLAVAVDTTPIAPDSSTLSGATVATGHALSASGAAGAAGAQLTLWAWPTDDVLDALNVDDTVKLQPVSTAVTASDGSFVFRIPSAASVEPFADSNGIVNYEIQGAVDDSEYDASFAQTVLADPGTTSTATPEPTPTTTSTGKPTPKPTTTSGPIGPKVIGTNAAVGVADDPDADDTFTEVPDLSIQPLESTSTPTTDLATTGEQADDKTACVGTQTVVAKYPHIHTTVGSIYEATTGVTARLTYSADAENEVGVAVSKSGKFGSFNQSGTSSLKTGATITFPSRTKSNLHERTDMNFTKFHDACAADGSGAGPGATVFSYQIRATSLAGGVYPAASTAPLVNLNYCVQYPATSGQTLHRDKATTYTTGVEISSITGSANLSIRAGYSSHVTLTYSFSAKHSLCGTTGDPAGTHPSRLVEIA